MLNMRSISIWLARIPRICLAKNPTFGNWNSCVFHQTRRLCKSSFEITIRQNKNNSDFSKSSLASFVDVGLPNNKSLGTSGSREGVCGWLGLRDLKTTTKSRTNFFCHNPPLKFKLYCSQLGLPHTLSPSISRV